MLKPMYSFKIFMSILTLISSIALVYTYIHTASIGDRFFPLYFILSSLLLGVTIGGLIISLYSLQKAVTKNAFLIISLLSLIVALVLNGGISYFIIFNAFHGRSSF